MARLDDVKRYQAAGMRADYFTWNREHFIKEMGRLIERLKGDKSLEPRACFGLTEKGVATLWHFTAPAGAKADEGDDGFEISWPCPPCEPL